MPDFDSIPPEDRADWRADPTTEALITSLATARREVLEDIANTLKSRKPLDVAALQHLGGRLAAIDGLLEAVTT